MSLPGSVRKCQSQGIEPSRAWPPGERPEAGLAAKNGLAVGGVGVEGPAPVGRPRTEEESAGTRTAETGSGSEVTSASKKGTLGTASWGWGWIIPGQPWGELGARL